MVTRIKKGKVRSRYKREKCAKERQEEKGSGRSRVLIEREEHEIKKGQNERQSKTRKHEQAEAGHRQVISSED